MPSIIRDIQNHQRSWAIERGISIDQSNYTKELDDNLFLKLSEAAHSEFSKGDGSEIVSLGKRSKMQALHSSSALAYNVFEYWRSRDKSVLSAALGLTAEIVKIEFERKFPTGLRGNPPNLDIVLTLSDNTIVAIESKFLEPYYPHDIRKFSPSYFKSNPGLWAQSGYSNCQKLALRLNSGESVYHWLDANQLLKHILGLTASGMKFELLYLWFESNSDPSTKHAVEVNEFADTVTADGIVFRSMTYQSLFIKPYSLKSESDKSYLAYLDKRYFGK